MKRQILFVLLFTVASLAQEKSPAEMRAHMQKEAKRTNPDFYCYIPGSYDYTTPDSHNEHFLTFNGPDGSLMAVWTQSVGRHPQKGNRNRIVFARSDDEGVTWSEPSHVVGPRTVNDPTNIASWAFPMVANTGRIYVLYNRNIGKKGWIHFHTGIMEGVYSDDKGKSWSDPQQVPLPKSPYDDPEGEIPPEWIVWQNPIKDLNGNYFVGYSHWVNKAVAHVKNINDWTEIESVVEFMRFTNLDNNPDPKDIAIEFSAWGENALRVPHRHHPYLSITQEPSIVRLPDNSLFCVMRTCSGYIWWSRSMDDGKTWSNSRPLLYKDHGQPLMNPVGCDPIYPLSDGRYIILYHNNPGGKQAGGSMPATPREPLFLSLAEYRPNADQPLWFSQPKKLMATEGVGLDGIKRKLHEPESGSLSMYSSFTNRSGQDVLWYPDRKCFLLGKRITSEFLSDLRVPRQKKGGALITN
jgi:hypothetical protein